MSKIPNASLPGKREAEADIREALFNEGAIGSIQSVQVSTERIVTLRGILFDLDPDMFRKDGLLPVVPEDPREFYEEVVRPMLDNHPVLSKAEVRNSGRGLHAILRFATPIEFKSAGERDRWAGIIEVVQAALPVDPNQPGITSTTRAVGRVNSKNGAVVEVLAKGEAVTEAEVLALYTDMVEKPFSTVMRIMTGGESQRPCPLCHKENSSLAARGRAGKCYSCGTVHLDQLYDLVLAPTNNGKEVKAHAKTSK